MGLCGKKPKPPPTPDPAAVSAAQTQSNQQTAAYTQAMNRGNVTTPWGSQTFSYRGTDPATGAPIWDENISLSPDAQGQVSAEMQQGRRLAEFGTQMIDRMGGIYSQPMDTSTLPTRQSGVNGANLPSLQGGIDTRYMPTRMANFDTGNLPSLRGGVDMSNAPTLQGGISYNGAPLTAASTANGVSSANLPKLWGAEDLQAERQQVQDALYGRNTALLDPQWQQRETAFRTRMANQGVVEGSEAWRNALDDENRARSFDYARAREGSILGGANEMTTLSGISRGNRADLFGERATSAQIQNQAAGINNAFSLGKRSQEFSEAAARAGFTNDARRQALAEGLSLADLSNSARGQGYDEAFLGAAFNNDARDRAFSEAMASAGFTNAARGQGLAEGYQAAGFNNDARDAALREMYALRAQPLQEYATLRGTAPVQQPNFTSPADQQLAPTDVSGNIWNAYQGNLNVYNQQMASRNALMGGLMNLGGSLGGAAIMASDERVKENVEPEGVLPDGTNVYSYNYIGEPASARTMGVMAQEVEKQDPAAVITGPDGVKRVNYARVLARVLEAA